jgi:hypothetical protein
VSKRELRFDITGNADRFGEAAKKAQEYVNGLKSAGLDALTAGVYTGGAMALATKTIDAIKSIVVDLRSTVEMAARLNIANNRAIDLRRFSSATGVEVSSIESGVQQARKARADALAGDDQAVRAFESIGISLEKIKSLRPDELFFEVLKTASLQELNAERFFSYAKLLGEETATQTLPIARSREAMQAAELAVGVTGVAGGLPGVSRGLDASLRGLGLDPAKIGQIAVRSLRQPFEPFSQFGVQTREQTDDAAEINRQKLALVARAQLTTEERINEAIAERLRLNRLIEDESDPLKRQKLIAGLLNVEAEIGGLATKRGTELVSSPTSRTQDPLRAIGADFSSFFMRRDETGKQQVDELRRLRSTIAEGLQRVERAINEEPR